MASENNSSLLGALSCRVLDLAGDTVLLAGKILADLGAEVIKIEKPGGDPARLQGPFYQDKPGKDRSLPWLAYNAGKKGVTLDIEAKPGQEVLKRLAAKSDIIIESFAPGYLDKIGLGFEALKAINPKLILTSITPFGQEGPYRDYKASSLVLQGACGFMYITGDPDRPPVQTSFPAPYLQACTQAVAATMVAYYFRQKTGQGQHVDVAAQHSSVLWGMNAMATWQLDHRNLHREGQFRAGRLRTANPRYIWRCKDGYVAFNVGGGSAIYPRVLTALMKWMGEEVKQDDFLKTIDWFKLDMSKVDRDYLARMEKPIAEFFLSHTKAELYEGAVQRRVMLYPVQNFKDIAASSQLKSRDFWVEIKHDDLGASVTYPGPFTRSTLCQIGTKKRAPQVGEHNDEIYAGVGFSRPELAKLRQAGVI